MLVRVCGCEIRVDSAGQAGGAIVTSIATACNGAVSIQ